MSVGIIAYGSLIGDPGTEISPVILRRISTITPFPVEYARLSGTRGGAPTVVPYASGEQVKAEVLVLSVSVSLGEARNMLWRRETRQEGTGRCYIEGALPSAVLVRDAPGLCDLSHVLYTDFNQSGKISDPDPRVLAEAAIGSVAKAQTGKDGISYLMELISAGVQTPLTAPYVDSILALTGCDSLAGALTSRRQTKS